MLRILVNSLIVDTIFWVSASKRTISAQLRRGQEAVLQDSAAQVRAVQRLEGQLEGHPRRSLLRALQRNQVPGK